MIFRNPRNTEAEVDAIFADRWSPRVFAAEPLARHQVDSLLEAARWAPSCSNEQPWLFAYAVSDEDRNRFLGALVEKNQSWARRAPVLMFLLVRRTFARSGGDNRHAWFDAGAAWMSLALQARRLGLYAHAMAGFNADKAYEVTRASRERYDIVAAIAVGRRGDAAAIAPDMVSQEAPNERKPLADMGVEGGFPQR